MTDKPSDFLDLFDLPLSTDKVPAPPAAPKSADEQASATTHESFRPSMFDGVLDDLMVREPHAQTEGRVSETAVLVEPEPVIEPEPLVWDPEPEAELESEVVEPETDGPAMGEASAQIAEPVEDEHPADIETDENEFWPGEETPATTEAHDVEDVEAVEASTVYGKLEEQGANDPNQTREDDMDALVADVQASPNPEQCVVLVHSPQDKAQMEERLGDTPAQVNVVRPAATKSRMPLLAGVGVVLLAAGAIGWWTLSSNKESFEPTVATAPTATVDAPQAIAEPVPEVQAPASPQPLLVNPADLVVDVVQPTPQSEPTPPQVSEPEPVPKAAPAPTVAKATPAPAPTPKPKAKPAPKPEAKPIPEKSWQDDALNQLDELEKRL